MGRLSSTRAVLIIIGILSALLAIAMRQVSIVELPTRDLCVIVLVANTVVGVGGGILLDRMPPELIRGAAGAMLMIAAAFPVIGFASAGLRDTDGFVNFLQYRVALWAWLLIFYLGFVIWSRRHGHVVRGSGSET